MSVAYLGISFGGSTNSVEDRGQRERGSGGDSPLVRGSVHTVTTGLQRVKSVL